MEKNKKEKNRKINNKKEEDYKKDLYKKWSILIIGIIIVAILGILVFNSSNRNKKEKKAEEIFGTQYCDSVLHMATNDLQEHTCSICGKNFKDSGMRADICDKCAEELDRCNFCGKKLSEDIKKQRNELLGE